MDKTGPWWDMYVPPDDVLIELGRLTWSATNLEGDVHLICRCIGAAHGPWDDCPVSTHAQHGLDVLIAHPDSELRTRAEDWLTEAIAALADRNAIVHSTPVTVVEPTNATHRQAIHPEDDPPFLFYVPNKTGRTRGDPAQQTSPLMESPSCAAASTPWASSHWACRPNCSTSDGGAHRRADGSTRVPQTAGIDPPHPSKHEQ